MSLFNWYLRGGFARLLVWDPATGTSVDTPMVRPGADVTEDKETALYTDGSSRPVGDTNELVAGVASYPAIRQLRAWETAATEVRALLLARGRGPNRQWEEPAVPMMTRLPSSKGGLTGALLRLQNAAVDAAVYDSPDLLEPYAAAAWDGSQDRALPAPGIVVYAWVPDADGDPSESVLLQALAFDGTILAGDEDYHPQLTLPTGTYAVRLTSASRPVLSRWPADGFSPGGGFRLVSETAGSVTLEAYGSATALEGTAIFEFDGVFYTIDVAELEGDGLVDGGDFTVLITTTP